MMELFEVFQYDYAWRALLASVMVGLMCGVLGCFIVLRNMALIGDALSHSILPGVVVAFMIFGYSVLGFFVGSVIAGLLTAFFITWLQNNVKTKNDAAIGIVYTFMFALGVIGISRVSNNDGAHLDLKDFLFGNSLGVADADLQLTFFIMVYVLASIFLFYRYLFATTFQPIIARTMGISTSTIHYFMMLLLSFAVVASLQTVGVILVVAMLVTPASTALLLSKHLPRVILIAAIVGVTSAILGLAVAFKLDTPPGPAIAVVAALIYLVTVFFAPETGIVFIRLHQWRKQQKIHLEDTLKQTLKLHQKKALSVNGLNDRLSFNTQEIKKHLKTLEKRNWIIWENEKISMTTEGEKAANKLVRAHRLWETYLVNQMGLSEDQIHEEAEKFEHILTEELIDEMEADLGYPAFDPHGSPIPTREGKLDHRLFYLELNMTGEIAENQSNDYVSAELWKLNLPPGEPFIIKAKNEEGFSLEVEGQLVEVPMELATQIKIKEEEAIVK